MKKRMNMIWPGDKSGSESEAFLPPVDIYEKGDLLLIEVELPGMSKEQIDLFVEGSNLVIEGAKVDRQPGKGRGKRVSFLQIERKFGRFVRVIELPIPCNTREIRARYEGGVLTVELKKIKDQRGRRIKVPVE